MNKQQYLEELRKQIEINKKNATKEIQEESVTQAMWSINTLINLKAQEGALKREFEQEGNNDR